MAQLELPSAERVAEVLAVLGPGGRIRSVGELERALGGRVRAKESAALQLAGLRGVLECSRPCLTTHSLWARSFLGLSHFLYASVSENRTHS